MFESIQNSICFWTLPPCGTPKHHSSLSVYASLVLDRDQTTTRDGCRDCPSFCVVIRGSRVCDGSL